MQGLKVLHTSAGIEVGIERPGIECVCAALVTLVTAEAVDESLAEEANVPVPTERELVVDPVVPVPVLPVPVLPVPVFAVPVVPVPVLVAVVSTPEEFPVFAVPVVPVPVLPVPVFPVPVLEVAFVMTEEAAAEPVSVPRVSLLDPLPKGTLSCKSGRPKVPDPSPVPKAVPITANSRAYVVLETLEPSHKRKLPGTVDPPNGRIVPEGIISKPPA